MQILLTSDSFSINVINEPTTIEQMKNKKTSTNALLRIILEMYKGDPEGLLDDLEISVEQGDSLKDWAQGCLEALEDE